MFSSSRTEIRFRILENSFDLFWNVILHAHIYVVMTAFVLTESVRSYFRWSNILCLFLEFRSFGTLVLHSNQMFLVTAVLKFFLDWTSRCISRILGKSWLAWEWNFYYLFYYSLITNSLITFFLIISTEFSILLPLSMSSSKCLTSLSSLARFFLHKDIWLHGPFLSASRCRSIPFDSRRNRLYDAMKLTNFRPTADLFNIGWI